MTMRLLMLVVAITLPIGDALSQTAPAPAPAPAAAPAPAKPDAAIQYRPPLRGAPARRVGGSARGSEKLPDVSVIAPDHVGLTVSEQPSLYWFISKATGVRIEITLIDSQGEKPIVETAIASVQPGIHRFSLADFSVRLKPEEEYQWAVSLVSDSAQRSSDVVSAGIVKRVALSGELKASLDRLPPAEHARELASAGIWYDAFAAASERIARAPAEPALRLARASLLEQVGLKEAAAFERQAAR